MFKIILLSFLFAASNALALNAPSNPQPNVLALGVTANIPNGQANIPVNNLNAVFPIYVSAWATRTANHVHPFVKNGVLYQVSSGVKAYCFAGSASTATSGNMMQFMYDTATFAQDALVGSLTAPKYQGLISVNWSIILTGTANVPLPIQGFTFPAGSWPGIQISATDNYFVTLWCYEGV